MTIGLKFLFEGGQWVSAGVPNQRIADIINAWQAGSTERITGVCTGTRVHWAVDLGKVLGLHSFDMDEVLEQVEAAKRQQGGSYRPPPGLRGYSGN